MRSTVGLRPESATIWARVQVRTEQNGWSLEAQADENACDRRSILEAYERKKANTKTTPAPS